jgi:MscS family membrane protein
MDFYSAALVVGEIVGVMLAAFVVGKFLYKIFLSLAKRLTAATKTNLDDFILQAVEGPLEAVFIVLVVFLASDYLANVEFVGNLILSYSYAITILLAAYLLAEVVGAVLRWYYEEGRAHSRFKMDVTLLPFLRKVSRGVILILGITSALAVVGFDISGVIAVASVTSLILGLASQETLANIFAGLALQLDRQVVYGEYLRFTSGEVARLKHIGVRSTQLDDGNGSIIVISNSEFAKQRLTNLSRPVQSFKSSLQVALPLKKGVFARFEKFIAGEVKSSKLAGLKADSCEVRLDHVGVEALTATVSFWVEDYPSLAAAKDFINRRALAFVEGAK